MIEGTTPSGVRYALKYTKGVNDPLALIIAINGNHTGFPADVPQWQQLNDVGIVTYDPEAVGADDIREAVLLLGCPRGWRYHTIILVVDRATASLIAGTLTALQARKITATVGPPALPARQSASAT